MVILGLNSGEIGASAALVKNGKLLSAAPEERFTRRKRTKAFPLHAIQFCLKSAEMTLNDCNFVAQAWNPALHWQKFNPLLSENRVRREDNFYTLPDNLLKLRDRPPMEWVCMTCPENTLPPPFSTYSTIAPTLPMPSIYHHLKKLPS